MYFISLKFNYLRYSESMSAVFMLIITYIAYLLLGYKVNKKTNVKNSVLFITMMVVVIYFTLTYGMGLLVGFLKNSYSLKLKDVFNNSIYIIISIICTEILRYIVINADKKDKLFITIFTIYFIIFEVLNSIKIYDYNTMLGILKFLTLGFIPILIKNLTLTYLSYYVGFETPIIYRLITECYIFFVPIAPDLGDYFSSVSLIILPFFVYVSNSRIINDYYNRTEPIYATKGFKFKDIPIIATIVIVVILISGITPLSLVGIATASMEPNINVGDAVLLYKDKETTNYNVDDVIAFEKENKLVVHRIIEVLEVDGEYFYNTKGDNNNAADDNYLARSDIKGIMLTKIPFIAYPSVWIENNIK